MTPLGGTRTGWQEDRARHVSSGEDLGEAIRAILTITTHGSIKNANRFSTKRLEKFLLREGVLNRYIPLMMIKCISKCLPKNIE